MRGDGTTEGEATQTEQGRIRLALSSNFTQLLTFFSRTREKEHISKNSTRISGPDGRAESEVKICTFGAGSTHFNGTLKDPSDVGGRGADGQTDN